MRARLNFLLTGYAAATREMSQSIPYQRSTEHIRNARENLVQGNSDNYFPTMQTNGLDMGSSSSLSRSDVPEDVHYLRPPSKSTLGELGSQGDSPSSVYTPRPYDYLPKPMVKEGSIDGQALLQPPSGFQSPATPDGRPKPALKQSLTSLLAEKRSSLHDILSAGSDQEARKPRRVSFADEDQFSPSVVPTERENSASESSDLTNSKVFLREITQMLFFELERRLKTNTPTPDNSRNPLPRSSSFTSVTELESSVDFVRVAPWDDRGYHTGRDSGGSGSWKQVKTQVFSWCNRHSDDYDGGPKQMVELRTLPVDLQDWILEFERSRIEQTQGHGKGKHRIVHINVSQVLNPS